MKKILNVNRHVIDANRKNHNHAPPLSAKTYKSNDYGHTIVIFNSDGQTVAARLIYDPAHPQPCGATVWIETHNEIEVL